MKRKKEKYKFNIVDQFLILFVVFLGSLIMSKKDDSHFFSVSSLRTQIEHHINIVYVRDVLFGNLEIFGNERESEVSHDLSSYETIKEIKDGIEVLNDGSELVINICDGVVVRKYKNSVIIKGIDGLEYHFGNLDSINVSLYEFVKVNETIGISIFNEVENKYIYTIKVKQRGNFINVKDVLGIV